MKDLKVFYYYTRFGNKPMITNCLVTSSCGEYARGKAVCSFADNPCKKIGKSIALSRAVNALRKRGDIWSEHNLRYSKFGGARQNHPGDRLFLKGEYLPEDLTHMEERLCAL